MVYTLVFINDVNQRRARLVLGWVTVGRGVNHVTCHPGQLSLAIPPYVVTKNDIFLTNDAARTQLTVGGIYENIVLTGKSRK